MIKETSPNIIAIGGGDNSAALHHAIEMTGVRRPTALIIPTEKTDREWFNESVANITDRLTAMGVNARLLHEFDQKPSVERAKDEIGRASLLYTLGGNTPVLLQALHDANIAQVVRDSIASGKVYAGLSAGALLPFELAHTNPSDDPVHEAWDYQIVNGLGVLPAVATPHADDHELTPYGSRKLSRGDELIAHFPEAVNLGYTIDNDASLVVSDGKERVIRTRPDAGVRRITRSGGALQIEELS